MRNKIKTIIWDLDNTLYKFDKNQVDAWNRTAANYAIQNGANINFEQAYKLAEEGWLNHRDSGYFFKTEYGINPRDMHIGVNKMLPESIVIPCLETPDLMNNMRDYRHVLLTLSIKDWANRVLNHTQLAEFFEPEFVFGAEDYNFEDKAHSPRGILTALDKIGGNSNEVMFVEDTLVNLKPVKEHTGVHTVYLHHNRAVNENDMTHVDLSVQDTPELLRWFKEAPLK